MLLAAVEGTEPRIVRVDPRDGSEATDLDLHDFLGKAWGMDIGYMIAAYNNMAEVRDHGDDVFLVGFEAFIPRYSQVAAGHKMFDIGKGRLEGNAWYLVRIWTEPMTFAASPLAPASLWWRSPAVPASLWWRRDRSLPRPSRLTAMQSISPGSMRTKRPRTIPRGSFAPPLRPRSAARISRTAPRRPPYSRGIVVENRPVERCCAGAREVASFVLVAALAASFPNIDIHKECLAAEVAAVPDKRASVLESCIAEEQKARTVLSQNWSEFSSSARQSCTEAHGRYQYSYVELMTCLQVQSGVNLDATS